MTATKRHQPIVFALVCALVLIGGSLKAHAENLYGYNPDVTSTYGIENISDQYHQLHINFTLAAEQYGAKSDFEACAKLTNKMRTSGAAPVEKCGPDQLWDKGQGKYRATWIVKRVTQYGTVCNTDASMKIKKTQSDGTVKESDWTDAETVGWGAC